MEGFKMQSILPPFFPLLSLSFSDIFLSFSFFFFFPSLCLFSFSSLSNCGSQSTIISFIFDPTIFHHSSLGEATQTFYSQVYSSLAPVNRWACALGATPVRFFVARLTDRRSGQLKRPAAVDLPKFQWGRRRDHLNTSIISPSLKIMMNQDLDLFLGLVMGW